MSNRLLLLRIAYFFLRYFPFRTLLTWGIGELTLMFLINEFKLWIISVNFHVKRHVRIFVVHIHVKLTLQNRFFYFFPIA